MPPPLNHDPVDPGPASWLFDLSQAEPGEDFLGVGADLEPGTVVEAYRAGAFPMPVGRRRAIGWWSPDPRGILPLDGLRVSRSLRASCRRYRVTVDTAFDAVIQGCADPRRPDGWIDSQMIAAYRRLHDLGWAHSIEVWSAAGDGTPRLAGGLYGLAVGGLFAGESMFHREPDASKVALVALVERLRRAGGARLLDVQWQTDHLARLGAVAVPRARYLRLLRDAVELPAPRLRDDPT